MSTPPPVKLVSFPQLFEQIRTCRRCPRLIRYCREIATHKRRASFKDDDYWGQPVPGFGDPNARLWVLGLAPAAHGGNRTGRPFTGDASGDFLFAALHRAGYASRPESLWLNDGLTLADCYVSAAVRCAPPDNKPTPDEQQGCRIHLLDEWSMLRRKRVILALGAIAWDAAVDTARRLGLDPPATKFAHARELQLSPQLRLIGSYHVSPRNTYTKRLTVEMFDTLLARCGRAGAETQNAGTSDK